MKSKFIGTIPPSMKNRSELSKIVNINGSWYYHYGFTVLALIIYLGFNRNLIVVDYNGSVLTKMEWSKTHLKDEDSIEILSMAGGG